MFSLRVTFIIFAKLIVEHKSDFIKMRRVDFQETCLVENQAHANVNIYTTNYAPL